MHYGDTWISVCVAMLLCQQACGGHSSTFPVICRSLPSISTSSLLPHFLSSFCSATLSLLRLPLSLSCTNVLSHHGSSLSLTHTCTHPLSSPSSFAPHILFWWTPISSLLLFCLCPVFPSLLLCVSHFFFVLGI